VARWPPVAASFRLAGQGGTKKVAGNCREKRATFIIQLSKVKPESLFLI
jgi:hypothetical protein